MSKIFFIHPSIIVVKQILFFLVYLGIAFCWIIPSLLHGPFLIYRSQLLRFSIYMSLTSMLLLYIIRSIFINLKSTVFILTNDKILKKSMYKTSSIPYSEITSLRFIHFPFGFGFGVIKTPSKTLHLTFLIDNLADLLQTLQGYLNKENEKPIFNADEIEYFKHQALISSFHMRQTYDVFRSLIYMISSSLLLGMATTFWFWNLPLLFALIWIILSALFPCFGFLGAYIIISKEISKLIKIDPESAQSFNTSQIYHTSTLITACAYFIGGIIYKNIWIYFWW